MSLLKKIIINQQQYEIYNFTGKVVSEKKWSETEVSGSGGGGSGYSGQGGGSSHTAPVSITSKTTRHDQFMLQGLDGKEKSFSFENLDLACREGNTLSVLWGIKEGKNNGPYWFVYNHNSEEGFPTEDYKKVFEPPFWMKTVAFMMGIFIAFLFGFPFMLYLILPFVSLYSHRYYYYGPQGNLKAEQFQESNTNAEIFENLAKQASKLEE